MAFDWNSLRQGTQPLPYRTGFYDPRPYPERQAEEEKRRQEYQAYLDAGGYDISGTTYTMDKDGNYVFPSGVYDRKNMRWISGGPPSDPNQNTWQGQQQPQTPPATKPPSQQPQRNPDWFAMRTQKQSYPTAYQRQRMPRWFNRTLRQAQRFVPGGARGASSFGAGSAGAGERSSRP